MVRGAFPKTTIGNDGFRWLCTIGPTMEWLCTIVEVYRPLSVPFLLRTSVKLTVKLARLMEGGNVGYTCTLVGVGEW